MKRPYRDIDESNAVVSFIGTEVENTPMLGHKTLFIVGIQDIEAIIRVASDENIEHIYLGANMSFDPETESERDDWDTMIDSLLNAGFWVTLDYDIFYHEYVLEAGYNEQNKFISMISVKLSYIDQLNYNACVKIDDKDFKASNAGVWVHSARDLLPRDKFTAWEQYTQDKPVDLQQV